MKYNIHTRHKDHDELCFTNTMQDARKIAADKTWLGLDYPVTTICKNVNGKLIVQYEVYLDSEDKLTYDAEHKGRDYDEFLEMIE